MLLRSLIFFLLLGSLFSSVSCWTYQEEYKLRKEYQRNYNKLIRPLKNMSDIVYVDAYIDLMNIQDFDLIYGCIKIEAYLTLNWQDEILPWNTTLYNITQLTVSNGEIWVPNVGFYNIQSDVPSKDFPPVILRNDGSVEKWISLNFKIKCNVNAYAFPFDKHSCQVDMYFDDYNIYKVKLRIISCSSKKSFDESNWKITMLCFADSRYNYSRGVLRFKLARKIRVKSFSNLLPLFIFLILNIMVGLLSVESGEKVTFATMVFLSNVVYLGDVNKLLPKEPTEIPLIFLCHLILTFLSGISVVNSIIACRKFWKCKLPEGNESNPKIKLENEMEQSNKFTEFREDNPAMKFNEKRKKYLPHLNIEQITFNVMTFISVLYAIIFTGLFSEYILR